MAVKLYEVEATFCIYVVAESKEEAERVGQEVIEDGKEKPDSIWASEATSVVPEWQDSMPYNTGTDHSCQDWLEGKAVQG